MFVFLVVCFVGGSCWAFWGCADWADTARRSTECATWCEMPNRIFPIRNWLCYWDDEALELSWIAEMIDAGWTWIHLRIFACSLGRRGSTCKLIAWKGPSTACHDYTHSNCASHARSNKEIHGGKPSVCKRCHIFRFIVTCCPFSPPPTARQPALHCTCRHYMCQQNTCIQYKYQTQGTIRLRAIYVKISFLKDLCVKEHLPSPES